MTQRAVIRRLSQTFMSMVKRDAFGQTDTPLENRDILLLTICRLYQA